VYSVVDNLDAISVFLLISQDTRFIYYSFL